MADKNDMIYGFRGNNGDGGAAGETEIVFTDEEVDAGMPTLPEVGGRRLHCSNAEFERRCLVHLAREERKLEPDNGLVALLGDAVRLAREYTDAMQQNTEL